MSGMEVQVWENTLFMYSYFKHRSHVFDLKPTAFKSFY